MPHLRWRVSIALTVLMVFLLSPGVPSASRPRSAPQDEGLLNNLITGVWYDIVNQAKAERHLQMVQAKLMRDTKRGNKAAADRDAYRINNLKYRIVVDEWLIRKNSAHGPGPLSARAPARTYLVCRHRRRRPPGARASASRNIPPARCRCRWPPQARPIRPTPRRRDRRPPPR